MIDPFKITDFNRSDSDIQEFILFSIAVAGKTAVQIAKALDLFLKTATHLYGEDAKRKYNTQEPFAVLCILRDRNVLQSMIKKAKLGKWSVLTKGFTQICGLYEKKTDFRTISIDALEEICGIGLKTSRFFVVHSRETNDVVALDTHRLKKLRDCGIMAPESTPTSKKEYRDLEKKAIQIRNQEAPGMPEAEYDLKIWTEYTKTKPLEQTA